MKTNKAETLGKELTDKISKIYFDKKRGELIIYGFFTLAIDIFTVVFISKLVPIIKSLEAIHITILITALILSITISVFFIKQNVLEAIAIAKRKYTWGIGELSSKETERDGDYDNNGYYKYFFYISDNKFKCLISDDFKHTDIGDECILMFINNKPAFAMKSTLENVEDYVDIETARLNYKQERKQKKAKHKKQSIFKRILAAYDAILDAEDDDNYDD